MTIKTEKQYMLDTNMVSFIIKGSITEVRKNLENVPMSSVFISSITEAEILYGVAKRPEATKLHRIVGEFMQRVDVVSWDSGAAAAYAKLRADSEKAGKMLGNMDMLIAAHSIAAEMILVTNDKAFYQFQKVLELEDWSKEVIH